jgi:hypothetical protein
MANQSLQRNPVEQWMQVWPKMVARAWSDDTFLARLTKESADVAAEYGLPVHPNFRVQLAVGEAPPTLMLSIPPKPAGLEDVEDLGKVSEHKVCGHSCCF